MKKTGRMLDGVQVFFLREGDKVLTDQMGFVISKEEFESMLSQVYETYQLLTDEQIEAHNDEFGKKHYKGFY